MTSRECDESATLSGMFKRPGLAILITTFMAMGSVMPLWRKHLAFPTIPSVSSVHFSSFEEVSVKEGTYLRMYYGDSSTTTPPNA